MQSFQLRKEFLDFFEKKGHKIVGSSSLIPADPTSLFTSAGMQQFVPYLSGEIEPPYKRACSVQKCLRVDDINEVGDASHHTFFEMLGNWSFGDYFKQEAIDFALEFLVEELKLDKSKMWISIFKGEQGISKDEESIKLWKNQGIEEQRIFGFGMKDNFWGPVGQTGPCGPCSEIFYDLTGIACTKGNKCGPNCECGRFVEIWNLVFMEYNKVRQDSFEKLPQQNVDTGVGFERLVALLQEKSSNYETDLFWPIIQEIEAQVNKKYEDTKKRFRILADHIRASCFIIADGVLPSNTDRGYVLRMLLRRIIRHSRVLGLPENWYVGPVKKVSDIYGDIYSEVKTKQTDILTTIQEEEEKFAKTLEKGEKEFQKLLKTLKTKIISGKQVFDLYQTYGFPLELTREMAQEKGFNVDEQGFKQEIKKHRDISRKGAEKKFGGVGIEQLEAQEDRDKATKLHTATHFLHTALRQILGQEVKQMGSDITPDRLRFDFSYSAKLSNLEIQQVQDLVNKQIRQNLIISKQEMPYEDAIKSGALAFFKEKYPQNVSVYTIQDSSGNIFSKEVCRGPHVKQASELGSFKIIKQESCGAGIRRIKALLEC